MARTPEGSLLTERHRRLQLTISASTIRDLLQLWGTVSPGALADTIGPFSKAGAVLVRAGRRASGVAAVRYYSDFRRLEGVHGAVAVTMAPPMPDDLIEGGIRGAGLSGILNATRRGMTDEAAHRNGFVKLAGTAANLVLGGGRHTLMGAIHSDPQARGWQRVTDPNPCAFCAMVASRGVIFKSDGGAGFQAHGHCGCSAEPAFEGTPVRPDNERFAQAWKDSTKGLSGGEALNAFRQHLAT